MVAQQKFTSLAFVLLFLIWICKT